MTIIEKTVKEYAAIERVDPRTVWRWIDKGAVQVRRTPGGGVRVLMIKSDPAQGVTSNDSQRHPYR